MTVHSEPTADWMRSRVPGAAPAAVERAVRSWAGKAADRERVRSIPLDPTAEPPLPAHAETWLRPCRPR
ncbi:hypothetical protein RB614_03435 [Phytohabitans sp. ZYX-F-186]|uniref:Uncharacterized protein n=1 Tax=Phytohabitans maris TaxID=3071409 RepID=A0ABU0Z926_9ACTN|nr:hypothetical protein [Phytohabitans sp. ZYX-F-186]MDQ7903566.1 hypothetical protein [Phytohabitans sp. ZYX-F-186]